MSEISMLQRLRSAYEPKIPEILKLNPAEILAADKDKATSFAKGANSGAARKMNVGVILSGGQAPGGHNVIAGLFDAIKAANPGSTLYGFHNGPGGLVNCDYEVLEKKKIDEFRNTGGFDIIGSGRTKIETDEQIKKSIESAKKLDLDALLIIGGDDSMTNAHFLSKYFAEAGLKTTVCGAPKTIDGDLKNQFIETSFGFDTASKSYTHVIGDLARDTISAKKYWHFVKLMGRSASHITLECALETRANITLIGEEIEAKKMTLKQITDYICSVIAERSAAGKDYGIALIPEGVIEFIPEIKALIAELNDTIANYEAVFLSLSTYAEKIKWLESKLSAESYKTLLMFPPEIGSQFLGQRDPHGNVQVSLIETEKLFALMAERQLEQMRSEKKYSGSFSCQPHFYGYEGRCAAPSNFDADYCYALGRTAFLLLANGKTGCVACVKNLAKPYSEWVPGGILVESMMNMEKRNGVMKSVVKKTLVDLDGKPFKFFAAHRDEWAKGDEYVFPGAIQYFGPAELCDEVTETLKLEQN